MDKSGEDARTDIEHTDRLQYRYFGLCSFSTSSGRRLVLDRLLISFNCWLRRVASFHCQRFCKAATSPVAWQPVLRIPRCQIRQLQGHVRLKGTALHPAAAAYSSARHNVVVAQRFHPRERCHIVLVPLLSGAHFASHHLHTVYHRLPLLTTASRRPRHGLPPHSNVGLPRIGCCYSPSPIGASKHASKQTSAATTPPFSRDLCTTVARRPSLKLGSGK